jgi:hypothetical protein
MSKPSIHIQSKLEGREIRLLYLCASPDSQRQLECYCRSFDLDDAPPFEALSYVWGDDDPSTKTSILFNDKVTQVGESLSDALTRLRLPDSTRILWADALCINQDDNEEKSHQVPLMRSIYSSARRTAVWLGHGDTHRIQETIKCVRVIADACREYGRTRTLARSPSKRYNSLTLPEDLFNPDVCSGLSELYSLPWFERVWCVQEICLARDGIVLWGEEEVPWSDMGLAANWIFDKTTVNSRGDPVALLLSKVPVESPDALQDAIEDAKEDASLTHALLLDVLDDFRGRECGDLKDKVYGLLGLVALKEAEAIQVDYNKSVGEVYADTVLANVRLHSRLMAFTHVSHPEEYEEIDGFSSWVPHWDDWSTTMGIVDATDYGQWSACARQPVRPTDVHNLEPTRLSLTGIMYDTVTDVQGVMSSTMKEDLDDDEKHPFLVALDALSVQERSTEQMKKFTRTMTTAYNISWGKISYLDDDEDDDNDSRATYYGAFSHLLRELRGESDQKPDCSAEIESASAILEDNTYIVCDRRRIFSMSNGSYGMGPQCMRPGDIVVVLYGGNTPYILRPKGEDYLFMGEAYVDELMHGKLVHEVEAGHREEQIFCLV